MEEDGLMVDDEENEEDELSSGADTPEVGFDHSVRTRLATQEGILAVMVRNVSAELSAQNKQWCSRGHVLQSACICHVFVGDNVLRCNQGVALHCHVHRHHASDMHIVL